jgi:hypothetical protein
VTTLKRPMLTTADRNRLRSAATKADTYVRTHNTSMAYAQGVIDVLRWLADNADPSPMLTEVTR